MIVLFLAVAVAAAVVRGQAPVGLPSLVSPADGRDHLRPAIAAGPAGAVLVWQGESAASGTYDIFAQLYTPEGSPRGPAFVANQYTAFDQRRPAVAMDGSGGFIVVWDGPGDGDSQGIFARRFSPAGSPLGDQFALNQTSARGQFAPSVALAADGGFVAAWHGNVAGDSSGVAMRRFAADNSPLAGETSPYDAAAIGADQRAASLAMAADGSFALAWEELSYDQGGTAASAIRLRRYDQAGLPAESPVLAATATNPAWVEMPAVALAADGALAVAWVRNDAAGSGVELRRAAAGGALAEPLPVSAGADDGCQAPSVAFDPAGALLAAWGAEGSLDGGPIGLAARLFPAGAAAPEPLLYPALPSGYASMTVMNAAAAATGAAQWLMVWDNEQPTSSLPVSSVYLRRLALAGVAVSTGGDLSLGEGEPPISLRVALRTPPAAAVSVTLSPGSDQLALGGGGPGAPLTLSFTPDDAAPRTVAVAAVDDSSAEGPRQATLSLSVSSADQAYATAPLLIDDLAASTITFSLGENDQAAYGVSASAAALPEGGSVTLTISRAGAAGGAGSVRYSLEGAALLGRDYRIAGGSALASGSSGTISFAPGESAKTILLSGIDNRTDEGDRQIRLSLSSPAPAAATTISQASATILLVDDDEPGGGDPLRLYLPLLMQ